jgi:hypothetical protein
MSHYQGVLKKLQKTPGCSALSVAGTEFYLLQRAIEHKNFILYNF